MTLLVSWVGVDTKGTSSIYIAADSRITWGKRAHFDYGRKVFAFNNHPDILGYVGDVLFPSMVLGQILEMGDHGLLFDDGATCKQKFEAIKTKIFQIFKMYPSQVDAITTDSFQIIYASREKANHKRFFCHTIEWRKNFGWKGRQVKIPEKSGTLFVLGSGAKEFNAKYNDQSADGKQATSRNVFHTFCETLFNINDVKCGGAPQLVGVYRNPKLNAIRFGIIRKRKRYLFGSEVGTVENYEHVLWKNDNFENCDGRTKLKRPESKSRPKNR